MTNDGVAIHYKQQIGKMRQYVQLIMDLGNPNLQDHHWEEIFTLIDAAQYSYVTPFTFAQLLQANINSKR